MVRSSLVFAVAFAAPVVSAGAPSLGFRFDADYSGVDGTIEFKWDSPKYSGAKVTANLKFDRMDMKALKAFDSNCSAPVTEYTWHIHTLWNMPAGRLSTSAGLQGCAKAITGNHYDPYKICGPASEYIDTPACQAKVKDYKCTPDEYKKNFAACETGDLSGKFGTFKVDKKGAVKAEWYDQRFPFYAEVTPKWNIVIHAVCGKATPRVACSSGSYNPARLYVKSNEAVAENRDNHKDRTAKLDDEAVHIQIHAHHVKNRVLLAVVPTTDSEFAGSPECAPKVKNYNCTPESYKANFALCEAGDLSGKFGSIRPTSKGMFVDQWHDTRFPFWSEVTPSWNIVLHAVCGSATPRVACSNARKSLSDMHTQNIIKANHKSHVASRNAELEEEVHVKIAVHKTKKNN